MPTLISRNFIGSDGKSSIRLELELWNGLVEVCRREGWTRDEAIAVAQFTYQDRGVTSAVRTYLVMYFRAAGQELRPESGGHAERTDVG